VIVGAGPTGVELAGAIAEIARQTLKNDFRSIHPQDAQITLLDASPRLLMTFPEDLAQKAEQSLAKLGVHAQMGARVEEVDRDGLTVQITTRGVNAEGGSTLNTRNGAVEDDRATIV